MKITPNIIRYEFIGTEAKILESKNQGCMGISGKVVDETRNTLVILHNGERKRIIKNLAIFHFNLPDGMVVRIDGKLLVGRAEDRVKKRIKRLW